MSATATPREQGAQLARESWQPLTDEQIESAARILATVEVRDGMGARRSDPDYERGTRTS